MKTFFAAAAIAALGAWTVGNSALAQQAASKPTVLRVAHASPNPQHTAFWVAKAENFFADEGIAINNIDVGGGPGVLQALSNGHVDVGLFSISTAIQAHSFNRKLIVVAGLGNRALQIPVVSTAFLKSRGLDPKTYAALPFEERLRHLKGSRWPISGVGLVDTKLRVLVRSVGFDPEKDIEIIPFANSGGPTVTLLKSGRFDAAFLEPPRDIELVSEGRAVPIFDTRKLTELPEITHALQSQAIVERGWADKNADTLSRFGKAIVRAANFIHTEPRARVAQGLRKEFPELSEQHIISLIDSIIDAIPQDARLSKEVLEINIDLAQNAGDPNRPKPKLSVDDIYTERFLPPKIQTSVR